jgi:formate C-acetyltransferase
MSCLLDGCLTRRRDLVHGGARYNYPGINVFGGANVCDGLLAVKRCVFEQQRVTMQELCQALRDNFVGYEHVRQLLAHSGPRFGNDVPEVDAFANEVNAIHATFCWPHVDSRNGQFLTGVWPVGGHVGMGHWTGATPDGRLKGTPLVDGVGACQGADRKGPTALLRSVARLHVAGRSSPSPFARGSTCNIKFSGRTISWTATSSPEGVASLRDLVTTFMALGGHQLQINVVDGATLRAAQAGPEAYADLLVRVGGFSAYFVQLGRDIQEEIISRTEHSL